MRRFGHCCRNTNDKYKVGISRIKRIIDLSLISHFSSCAWCYILIINLCKMNPNLQFYSRQASIILFITFRILFLLFARRGVHGVY